MNEVRLIALVHFAYWLRLVARYPFTSFPLHMGAKLGYSSISKIVLESSVH
jgi:hypothetical protein